MASRWHDPPRLRTLEEDDGDERHATWLELFFDLVFVVAVAQLASSLSHDLTLHGFLVFCGLFVPVWWAWVGYTFYADRFDTDDVVHRLLMLGGMFAVGALASEGGSDVPAHAALTFQDPRIDESSGLVVRDGRVYTVNDSGDGAYVYQVDPRTGRTVAVTTYDDEDPTDVEALAAGPDGALWVGDIGDNRRWRGSVRVHRIVPVRESGTVPSTTYDLAYPGGPHDAETLLVHPRTGRLLLVTKGYGGGVVYRAPRRLRAGETHVLEQVGRVQGLVTDGTFLAGGDRLLLRTYGTAELYSYPGLRLLARTELPRQELGEGIAVDGRSVYLSSEGEGSDVLTFPLSRLEQARVPAAEQQDHPATPPPGTSTGSERDPRPWMGLGPAGFLLAALGAGMAVLALRAALRRGRRRR